MALSCGAGMRYSGSLAAFSRQSSPASETFWKIQTKAIVPP
jgi:hypothetical protein